MSVEENYTADAAGGAGASGASAAPGTAGAALPLPSISLAHGSAVPPPPLLSMSMSQEATAAAGATGVPPQPAPVSTAQLALIDMIIAGCPSYVTDDTKRSVKRYLADHLTILDRVRKFDNEIAYADARENIKKEAKSIIGRLLIGDLNDEARKNAFNLIDDFNLLVKIVTSDDEDNRAKFIRDLIDARLRGGAASAQQAMVGVTASGASAATATVPLRLISMNNPNIRKVYTTNKIGFEGLDIAYVPPTIFDSVFEVLWAYMTSPVAPVDPKVANLQYPYVFINGATGCGKTRMGYELFTALQTKWQRTAPNPDMRAIESLTYTILPVASDYEAVPPSGQQGHEEIKARNIQRVRAELATLLTREDLSRENDPLEHVLQRAKSPSGKALVIVVHIDEFQKGPHKSAAFIRAAREIHFQSKAVILTILTGLASEATYEALDSDCTRAMGVSRSVNHTFVLHYFTKPDDELFSLQACQVVENGILTAKGGSKDRCLIPRKEKRLLMLYRMIQDCLGWPFGLAQLGIALGAANFDGQEINIRNMNLKLSAAEQTYMEAVRNQYFDVINTYAQSGNLKVEKLLRIAMAPFPVAKTEKFNGGSTLDSLRAFGLSDIVPENELNNNFFVRVPRPLLAILNELCDYKVPKELLSTLRDTYGDLQEFVQLYSMTNALVAWSMLDANKDRRPTLADLRPGATMFNGDEVYIKPLKTGAAQEFNKFGKNGVDIVGIREPWEVVAKSISYKAGAASAAGAAGAAGAAVAAVAASSTTDPKDVAVFAGLFKGCEKAIDAWVYFVDTGVYIMQDKGEELKKIDSLGKFTKSITQVGDLVSAMEKSKHIKDLFALELMTATRVPNLYTLALKNYFNYATLLITGENIGRALGPFFAGIFEWAEDDRTKKLKAVEEEDDQVDHHAAKSGILDDDFVMSDMTDEKEDVVDVPLNQGSKRSSAAGQRSKRSFAGDAGNLSKKEKQVSNTKKKNIERRKKK